ncbi:MAG: YdcF family protein [Clostridia bacterium]|nr:YdcF family protein [Clostridia bacterium]
MKLFAFDTRDKKPKLYALMALSIVVAAVIAMLIIFDPLGNAGAACITFAAYCFAAILMLLYAFREQIKYNPYSYNTIIYFGFALFILFVMITHIVLAVRIFNNPEANDAYQIIYALLGSAKNYILLSSPFLFVFSAALCFSNISLIRHEGRRFVNLLGIVLSLLIIGGVLFLFFFDYNVTGSQNDVMIHDLITNTASAVFLYFECMLIGTIVADAITARHEPEKNKDFIIILGCGLRKDGTPTPLLKGRIERAVSFANKQISETGKAPTFITSGGKGPDEATSESAAMKRYLIEHDVPEKRIIEEDRSTDTFENMKFSKEIITKIDPDAKIAFSTTNYHVFRSGLFARRVKMRAVGMGAKTKWYFWPNAAVREFVGLLTNHRVKQALILLGLIAFYVALTFVAYR